MLEREARSARPEETEDDEEEVVCCVAEGVSCEVLERELLLGDMSVKESFSRTQCIIEIAEALVKSRASRQETSSAWRP